MQFPECITFHILHIEFRTLFLLLGNLFNNSSFYFYLYLILRFFPLFTKTLNPSFLNSLYILSVYVVMFVSPRKFFFTPSHISFFIHPFWFFVFSVAFFFWAYRFYFNTSFLLSSFVNLSIHISMLFTKCFFCAFIYITPWVAKYSVIMPYFGVILWLSFHGPPSFLLLKLHICKKLKQIFTLFLHSLLINAIHLSINSKIKRKLMDEYTASVSVWSADKVIN